MTVLADQLDRRFEAVVLVGGADARVAAAVAAATAGGLAVLEVPADGEAVVAGLDDLWRRGIGPSAVLVVLDGRRDQRAAVPLLGSRVTVACQADGATTLLPGAVRLGRGDLQALLADQLDRRTRHELPEVQPEPGWGLDLGGFEVDTERVHEALLAIGDGRVGTTGAPVARHDSTRPTVLVAGVYDGDGTESRLLSAPVALRLPYELGPEPQVRRVLDLRSGLLREDETTTSGEVAAVRFAALRRPGTVVLRARCPDRTVDLPLLPPLDDRLHDEGTADGCVWMRVAGPCGGVVTAACGTALDVGAGGSVQDRFAAYVGDPDQLPPPSAALDAAQAAAGAGFERLLDEQRRTWADRWEDADIAVEGDPDLQRATRLALFHIMGSVADEGEAAVGARGVTGHGYNGHVFWDADTFVLPFLAATHPGSARAMLEYRIRRLPAALAAARAQALDGARFPWESARTGDEVTPTSAYDRAGYRIPVRTGSLEVHIVAEVAWAACCYVDWSGDREFAAGGGLRLLVETARFWASRIEVDGDGSAHVRGVIGPDEYHEDVDDDTFTNVMARWNLRRAAVAVEDPATGRAGVGPAEVTRWRQLASALADGWDPGNGRHEQFEGFAALEPLIIAEVAPRRPIAADVLMGRERLQASQVVKQPAVLMLHHLVPDELQPGSLRTDLAFYEPRTAHGSSLSPGVHAALLARVGKLDRALEALEITAHIDLHDLTGSTASGIHLAAAGALWQALVMGFAGVRPTRDRLLVDPHVPPAWGRLDVRLRFRGSRLRLRCSSERVELRADSPVPLAVAGKPAVLGPEGLLLQRARDGWEVA
ncbi:MAG: glycosyl hydrolase family 65 protein [Mycobacteriales bacterium]